MEHSGSHVYKKHAKSIVLDKDDVDNENVLLLRKICEFYREDYECFDYPLPKVCSA